VAYALVLVTALLAPVAILGAWTQRHVVSADGYVATVGPLSSDIRVQAAVTNAVTNAVMSSVPTNELLASLPSGFGTAGQAARAAARRVVRASVTEVVGSSAFPALWVTANRSAQTQVLAELRGEGRASQLTIDLGPVAEAVRQQLVATGFTTLNRVRFDTSGVVLTVPTGNLSRAKRFWSPFESSMGWLVPILLTLTATALVIAPHRRRLLLAEALALLGSIGVTAVLTARGHADFGNRLQGLAAAGAAGAVGDALVSSLEHWLRALAAITATVSVGALAAMCLPTGRSRVAQ
jgi:hypothetical protein